MSKSSIAQFFQHLRKAKEFAEDHIRERPESYFAEKFENIYIPKIESIYRNIMNSKKLPPIVIKGIKEEWETEEPIVTDALQEKVILVPLELRPEVEKLLDMILDGESFKVVQENNISQ